MMRDYGVRVLHAYEYKRVGQVIYPPAMLRGKLIQAGLVEPVAEPEQLEEPKSAEIVRPVPMHEAQEPVTAVIAEPKPESVAEDPTTAPPVPRQPAASRQKRGSNR